MSSAALEAHSLALSYNELCIHPLEHSCKTQLLDQITQRIGSLSKPGKMPGYAWSIPADYCITGSKLAKIEGTPCSVCYAKKGRYRFSNVRTAMEFRLQKWKEDPDWVPLQAMRIVLLEDPYFRWFDSGDLQSEEMLININEVAKLTPQTAHWLPTQERRFVVSQFSNITDNLTVRVSNSVFGDYASNTVGWFSSSVSKELSEDWHNCPAHQQENKCGACRACWDKSVPHVVYHEH